MSTRRGRRLCDCQLTTGVDSPQVFPCSSVIHSVVPRRLGSPRSQAGRIKNFNTGSQVEPLQCFGPSKLCWGVNRAPWLFCIVFSKTSLNETTKHSKFNLKTEKKLTILKVSKTHISLWYCGVWHGANILVVFFMNMFSKPQSNQKLFWRLCMCHCGKGL